VIVITSKYEVELFSINEKPTKKQKGIIWDYLGKNAKK